MPTKTQLRKISRSQLKSWAWGHLKTKQGGLCPICGKPINIHTQGNKTDWVVDHDHVTGEVRGVLCRACNGAEGKVRHAIECWGKVGKDNEEEYVRWLVNLVDYYKQEGCGFMYPDHKSEEEKEAAAKLRRRMLAARKKAAERMKKE